MIHLIHARILQWNLCSEEYLSHICKWYSIASKFLILWIYGVCIFTPETLPGLRQVMKFKVALDTLSKSEQRILIKAELGSTVR